MSSPFSSVRERDAMLKRISTIQQYISNKPAGFPTGLTVEEATALIELRSAVDRAHERYKGRDKV